MQLLRLSILALLRTLDRIPAFSLGVLLCAWLASSLRPRAELGMLSTGDQPGTGLKMSIFVAYSTFQSTVQVLLADGELLLDIPGAGSQVCIVLLPLACLRHLARPKLAFKADQTDQCNELDPGW